MADFVHLHNHTEYSLLDGLSQIGLLVEKTKELGMKALAITDHGVMYGAIKFYNACKAAGIKPIIGCEIYMARRSRFDKQPKIDADQYHLVLLAKNFTGYQNLMKIVTQAHLEGFYYKPRADLELLEKYSKGLIAMTACIEGEVPSLILQNNYQGAKRKAEKLMDIFGEDFYLEIQKHPELKKQDKANKGIVKLSREIGVPLVATNDTHYINKEDAEAQDALLALQTQKTIDDPNRLSMLDCPDFFLKSPALITEQFADHPDALKNTVKIAEKCNLEIPIAEPVYPNYPLPADETAASYLRKLTYKGLPKRYEKITDEIKARVDYELDLIIKLGYPEYFLIVQDFVNWAKNQEIRVGPGRGSVAGSVVAYALRITSIDSLEHDLPFERFLNIERESTPDIDLDFPDDRRDEVIDYVRDKYGEDRVAHIITFGSMEARMAIRDVARVLNHPYSTGDRLAKLIPQGESIDKAVKQRPELKQAYNNPEVKKILDLAKKFTGVSRHASTHAAGVVITDKPLVNYTPLQRESNGNRIITQYDMYSLDLNIKEDALGLLKVDFLGLRNLTIIEKAKDYIKATTGDHIDLSEIPLNDKKVYNMITRGDTTGLFQMESQGMRRVAEKLKPQRFSDIAAMIALYRPGPMEWIDEFIIGKQDPSKIHYPHEDLKPVLEETYGIAVYQEQVMKIANVMADYTLGEGDILRRAIGKKKMKIMKKEEKRFKKRAKKKGYSEEVINKVWKMIKRFAGYGFNKAHTVSYAMIAYQNGWLKANYPVQFMAALMTAEANNENKLALAVDECRRMGIVLLPPDINKSESGFGIEKDKNSKDNMAVRCGFSAIKNVGEAAIDEILTIRKKGGGFTSLTDFCLRVNARKVNKTVVESLIKSGAMDQFGSRKSMLKGLENIRERAKKRQKANANGQVGLFRSGTKKENKITNDNLPVTDNFTKEELLDFEKELLGIYISEHPLQNDLAEIEDFISHKTHEIEDLKSGRIQIAGRIKNLRIVTTRNGGKEMAFTSIEDETGSIDLVIFPGIFKQNQNLLNKEKIVCVVAKVSQREGEQSIIAQEIKDISEIKKTKPKKKKIIIKIPKGTSRFKLVKLNSLLKKNNGTQTGTLHFPNGKKVKIPFEINWTKNLKEKIKELLS